MSLLEPYVPGPERPWTSKQVGHLLRRLGFGANKAALEDALKAGPVATVRAALAGREEPERFTDLDAVAGAIQSSRDIRRVGGWWILRMRYTQNPLRQKMTLFWHNHFATANGKVNDPALMFTQIATLERLALGRFADLLSAVSTDPAMLIWLDGTQSRRGAPNENYARELFELFTLGLGRYRESDIKEAARALTGWRISEGKGVFRPELHDDGEKTLFGRSGRFGLEDVIKLTLEQPDCAGFLARKLIEAFAQDQPDDSLVTELAEVIRTRGYDMGAALEVLLTAQAFYSDRAYRARIKSPVEFLVGASRALGGVLPGEAAWDAASRMGQTLLEPPSVKGWAGGRTWIQSAAMIARTRVAAALTSGDIAGGKKAMEALALANGVENAAAACRLAGESLLDDELPSALTVEFEAIVARSPSPAQALAEACYLCLVSPEYQLG